MEIDEKKYKGKNKRMAYQMGYREGQTAILDELISVFKDRPKLEQYTTNVIMLELTTRKDNL